jgi:acetyl-CoA carboxylase biotin carboxyl carrier protein
VTDPGDDTISASVVASLIQQLTERLTRHALGEIEVRRGELRVRVMAPPGGSSPAGGKAAAVASTPSHPAPAHGAQAGRGVHHPRPATPDPAGVMSPAVGYFAYAEGLGPGLTVEKGDQLGSVDVLGVRHEVRAPRSGVVRNLVTEAGEAVEYGQLLIELEAATS